MGSTPHVPQGDGLKAATRQLVEDVRARMQSAQGGVGTFADYAWLGFASQLDHLSGDVPWEESLARAGAEVEMAGAALRRLQALLQRREQGRFVEYRERVHTENGVHGSSDIAYFDMVTSQGVAECLQWKGMALFKTIFDFSLFPMLLWQLKPQTIIELGSGTGASAMWLADMVDVFGIGCEIHSVDISPPAVQRDRVRFLAGDCHTIDSVFDPAFLRTAPHPWLLIEDAHVNVRGVLAHFHRHLSSGDYVIVEDSAGKQDELLAFLDESPGYRVDTHYTDFFGRNATCAQDSILVRTDD